MPISTILRFAARTILLIGLCCSTQFAGAMTIVDAINPVGITKATLSPDGRHIAAIVYSGGNHAIILIDVDSTAAKIIFEGKLSTASGWINRREPLNVIWVTNDLLAADLGSDSESMTLTGEKVRSLGGRLMRKVDVDDPESPMVLIVKNTQRVAMVNAKTAESTSYNLPTYGIPENVVFDKKGQLRAVTIVSSTFGKDKSTHTNWYKPSDDRPWEKLAEFNLTDLIWTPLAVSDKENTLIVDSSIGRDTSAVFNYDLQKHEMGEMLAGHPTEDILDIEGIDQSEGFKGVTTGGMKPVRYWFDPSWSKVQKSVDAALPNRINKLTGNPKARVLVYSYSDVDPGRWYVLDTPTMQMRQVAERSPHINPQKMRPMEVVSYPAKDGLIIPSYLTRPANGKGLQPAVILIHGGPWVRDYWGWNPEVQLLAAHGYVVFQPQFRGSTGFGNHFRMAGYQQWGKSMQDDITAGVEYLIKEGIVDQNRICIVGASYGGYAALWGLVKTPDLYRCGISFAGVSDIADMLDDNSDTNRSKLGREFQVKLVGENKVSREQFDQVSPVKHADQIKAPLLLMHGTLDERVPISHSEKMKKAMDENHKTVEWLVFNNDVHGFRYRKNAYRFYDATLKFLDKYNPADPQPDSDDKPLGVGKLTAFEIKLMDELKED